MNKYSKKTLDKSNKNEYNMQKMRKNMHFGKEFDYGNGIY